MTSIEPDKQLFGDVHQLIDAAKSRTVAAVNREWTLLYWHIGKRLDQEILRGERADYGKRVIASLSSMLTAEYGRGWSKGQLHYCLQFAEFFPDESIVHSVSAQLSWTHLRQIISLDDALKRDFHMEMCRLERWSTRQLTERIESQRYERTALSRKPARLRLEQGEQVP